MSELNCIIGRISTNIGNKHKGLKVADLVKYVHFQEVGTFQNNFGYKILTTLHQNNDNISK